MAISVHCNSCGSAFSVPDGARGKRLQCIACGSEFSVGAAPAQSNPLDQLPSSSFTSAPSDKVAPVRGRAWPSAVGAIGKTEKSRPRAAGWGTSPAAIFFDHWLPWLLTIILFGPLLIGEIALAIIAPLAPLNIFLIVVQLVLLVWMVLPIADTGLRRGGSVMHFDIRQGTYVKIFATYTPVLISIIVSLLGIPSDLPPMRDPLFWQIIMGPLLAGLFIGGIISFFLFWLLFHLRFLEAVVAWVYTSGMYLVGLAVMRFLMFLLMLPINGILSAGGWKPPVAHDPREPDQSIVQNQREFLRRDVPPARPPVQRDAAEFSALREQSRQNLQQIHQAIADFVRDSGRYPYNLEELASSGKISSAAIQSAFKPPQPLVYLRPAHPEVPEDLVIAYDLAQLEETKSAAVLMKSGMITDASAPALRVLKDNSNTAMAHWLANQSIASVPPAVTRNNTVRRDPPQPRVVAPVQPPPVRKRDVLQEFDQDKSPLVASVTPISTGTTIEEIIHPLAPSALVALITQDQENQDTVEVWDLLAAEKKSQATFARDPQNVASYAINASGSTLARIAHWPKLSVRIWSMADQKETRSLPLNDKFGTPQLLGFLAADKFAIRWTRGTQEGLEIWDAATGQHGKQVNLERYQPSWNNGIVSPDGKYFALITTQTRTGKPQLQVYDLLGPSAGYRWVAINELDASTGSTPAGLAFSPDGKVAALFAHNGEGIIFCWRTLDQKRLGDYSITIPAPTNGAREITTRARRHPSGGVADNRGIEWVNDGAAWLVNNDLVVDANSGRQIGQLHCPPASDHWSVDAATFALRYDVAARDVQLASVKLDRQKLTQLPQFAIPDRLGDSAEAVLS